MKYRGTHYHIFFEWRYPILDTVRLYRARQKSSPFSIFPFFPFSYFFKNYREVSVSYPFTYSQIWKVSLHYLQT